MEWIEHNRGAWNRLSDGGILWAQPVDESTIKRAKAGDWNVALAGMTPVPHEWFGNNGDFVGTDILCLASGGGQQVPVLAAAGARVTSLELSDSQLSKDEQLAQRYDLDVRCEQGSMTDLSRFADSTFDTVFLPVALGSIPDVHPVWRESARVLRPHGRLLTGFINPLVSLFEENDGAAGVGLEAVNRLPFAEADALLPEERDRAIARGMVFDWSHTLTDLIGGQLTAGFQLLKFVEARRRDPRAPSINALTDTYCMTAAEKIGA